MTPGRYEEVFTAAGTFTVTHSLGSYPVVNVVDAAGEAVFVGVSHTDVNELVLTFGGTLTNARVICVI